MTEFLTALTVVLGLGVLALLYELHGMPRLRRRCIVNLTVDGADSIEGVLWSRRGRWVIVKDARLVRATDGTVTQADGELLIDRGQISFIQVL